MRTLLVITSAIVLSLQMAAAQSVSLEQAVDTTTLAFTTGGDAVWSGRADVFSNDGVDSAASGNIGADQESWMETTVTGPGTLTFWWNVTSTEDEDFLLFKVDGTTQRSISGLDGFWTKVTQFVGAGTHTFRWVFDTAASPPFAGDGGILDQVAFAPGGLEPGFLVAPASQFKPMGGTVSFFVDPSGVKPVQYQWLKGPAKAVLNGTTFQGFTKIHLNPADATVWWVRLTNIHGTEISPPAYLALYTPPPAAVTLKEGGVLSLSTTVTVPAGASIRIYAWERNGVALVDGTVNGVTIAGAGTKALKITGIKPGNAGGYTCAMVMTTPDGDVSGTNGTTQVTVLEKPVVTPFTLPDHTVSQALDFQINATGGPTKYTVTGLPAGVVVNAVTGRITGRPTVASALVGGLRKPFVLKVTTSNLAGTSGVVTVNWIIHPLDARVAGAYNALVDRNVALNGASATAAAGLGGVVKVQVSTTGGVSGTLKLGTLAPYPLKGALDVSTLGALSCQIVVPRKAPLTNLTLVLNFDPAAGSMAGTLSDGGANTPSVLGWLAAKTAAFNGRYHAGIFIDPALAGDAAKPQGTGYATLSVTGTGTVAWAARMPDGTATTSAYPVGPGGQVMVQALLYGNVGSVQGWVKINAADHFVDGDPGLSWFKAPLDAKVVSRSYKGGIPLQNLTVTGGPYVAKNVSLHALLGLGAPPLNAQARFSEGGLGAALSQSFSITAPNTVAVPTNPPGMKLSIASATGLITGSFMQPGLTATAPRKADVFGIVVPRLSSGVGYFLLPEQAVTGVTTPANAPIWSGKLEVGAPVQGP